MDDLDQRAKELLEKALTETNPEPWALYLRDYGEKTMRDNRTWRAWVAPIAPDAIDQLPDPPSNARAVYTLQPDGLPQIAADDLIENTRDLIDAIALATRKRAPGFDPTKPKRSGPMIAVLADLFSRGFQEALTQLDRPVGITVDQWIEQTTISDQAQRALALRTYNALRARAGLPAAGDRAFLIDRANAARRLRSIKGQ